MPIDASIYQAFAPRQKGALDYAQEFAGLDASRQALDTGAIQQQVIRENFADEQRKRQSASALEQLMGSMAGKSDADVVQGLRAAGRFNEAGAMEKSILEREGKRADIGKTAAETAKAGALTTKAMGEAQADALKRYRGALDFIGTNAGAQRWLQAQYADPLIAEQMLALGSLEQALARIPPDGPELERWRQQAGMGMEKFIANQTTQARDAQVARNDLVGPDGRPNQSVIDAKTRISAAGAAQNVTYGAPVAGRVDGQDVLLQTSNRGGPAAPLTVGGRPVAPPSKPSAATKPMPASALKMQQEELDAIGIAAKLDSTLAGIEQKLTDGKLQLGPIRNLAAMARNRAGMSTEQSKEFALLETALQSMRNDVLMMHKGVQTEGDAQRAMQTLMDNLNDPRVVTAQLARLRDLQQRAVALRQNNVALIRRNYEQPDIDMAPYAATPPPPAAPPAAPPSAAAGRTVTRTGTAPDGRKVIQYSDGTVEYATGR
jgi:hypothetical protein